MTVEVRPLGDKCNIKCRYCYQEGIRTAGNVPTRYDLDAIMATLDDWRSRSACSAARSC